MTTTDVPATAASAGTSSRRGGPVAPSAGRLRPLAADEVRITGGFWHDIQDLNSRVIIGHCLTWMERIGWLPNFDRAADGTIAEKHAGIEFVDSEVYKLLEAMAWELGRQPDPELEATYRAVVARVAAAQEADGYLHTAFGRPGQRPRFSDLEWGHELYSFGHLIQAAVARLRSGQDDELPAVARRLADFVDREFGPAGRIGVCGHPEIEVALVEFGRATGEPRYVELARLFVERRGTGTLAAIEYGPEYFQDDVPVRDAEVLRGHAVRALYLSAGALDVAVETGDSDLAGAVRRQWEATVARRTYITGGMGSHHRDEAYGADFELPPDRAYSETCAGIASSMLSWRLLLRYGDPRYADLMERTLLNNVLASPREDGRAFYYTNTLHQRVPGIPSHDDELSERALSSLRAPWFEVSCCPTNVARTLASAASYFATIDDGGLQLQQYGTYEVRTTVGGAPLEVDVASGYPYDGDIRVTFVAEVADRALTLRIPAWAGEQATIVADGHEPEWGDGVVVVRGPFAAGDIVQLTLPMQPRLSYPERRIDAVRGQVAVERGPLVLALESTDLPAGIDAEHVELVTGAEPESTATGARVRLVDRSDAGIPWPYGVHAPEWGREFEADLIPYYRWANRGPSTMRVFLPVAGGDGWGRATTRAAAADGGTAVARPASISR